jgi:hypothetical protein
MGFVNTFTASGQGSLSLGGLQNVNEVSGYVITLATYATTAGASGLRRVHHQGWYGIGLTPGAGPTAGLIVITHWDFIRMENWTDLLKLHDTVLADTLYWDIEAGGVMYLEVDW